MNAHIQENDQADNHSPDLDTQQFLDTEVRMPQFIDPGRARDVVDRDVNSASATLLYRQLNA